MKITVYRNKQLTISDFADQHNLEMEVHERSPHKTVDRYYAHFKNAEILEDGLLIGTYGDGATPERAIVSYAKAISQTCLVVNAFGPNRREVYVPRLSK